MARRDPRPPAQREVRLTPLREHCVSCEQRLWVAYHAQRTLMTFRGLVRLTLVVRRCRNPECALYHLPYRAEEEGAWALPHGEFGLDIITVIGQLRYGEHRSIPEIHQRLVQRGVSIAQRTVTDLLERYEELVALHLADEERLLDRLKQQGQVILAFDGMQPDVGARACSGSFVTACREKSCWHAPCSVVRKAIWWPCSVRSRQNWTSCKCRSKG